jgi:hypothetical protein
MNEKNTLRRSSENTESNSSLNRPQNPRSKYCNDGLSYWIYNLEHNCISYGKIAEDEPDVVETTSSKKIPRSRTA